MVFNFIHRVFQSCLKEVVDLKEVNLSLKTIIFYVIPHGPQLYTQGFAELTAGGGGGGGPERG